MPIWETQVALQVWPWSWCFSGFWRQRLVSSHWPASPLKGSLTNISPWQSLVTTTLGTVSINIDLALDIAESSYHRPLICCLLLSLWTHWLILLSSSFCSLVTSLFHCDEGTEIPPPLLTYHRSCPRFSVTTVMSYAFFINRDLCPVGQLLPSLLSTQTEMSSIISFSY